MSGMQVSRKMARLAQGLVLSSLALLAACGGDTARPNGEVKLIGEVFNEVKGRFAAKPAVVTGAVPGTAANAQSQSAQQAAAIEAMAVESLRLNAGPLMFASREEVAAPVVLGMIGENGATRTYATPLMQSVTLRKGIVVATRGLGDDMISADVEALSPAIVGRHAGHGPRVLRFLDGLGKERPLPLDCVVSPAKAQQSYRFAGREWSGTVMAEHCTGHGFDIVNSYVVAGNGSIVASRQWVSPSLGYFTLQVLRP